MCSSDLSQTFRFRDVPSKPVPSLLRGFSAPVNLTLDLTDRDLEFLAGLRPAQHVGAVVPQFSLRNRRHARTVANLLRKSSAMMPS